MCAIFEDGDDKDPSKLRTGADGFREELLKQGNEMYAARPSCGAAVDALLVRLELVLRQLGREEASEGATPEVEAAEAETLLQELMPDARWRQLLGKVRERLAVAASTRWLQGPARSGGAGALTGGGANAAAVRVCELNMPASGCIIRAS